MSQVQGIVLAFVVGVLCFVSGYKIGVFKDPVPIKRLEILPDSIAVIQERLQELGYYEGKIDGKFGPQTQKAYDRYTCETYGKRYGEVK